MLSFLFVGVLLSGGSFGLAGMFIQVLINIKHDKRRGTDLPRAALYGAVMGSALAIIIHAVSFVV